MEKYLISVLYWIILFSISVLPFIQSFNYGEALSKSILYFEAQRSGHLPYNQRVKWRHHSGLSDGLLEGVDLVGGYYDAGDNIKFGLPMAFTITMLSWSVLQYQEQVAAGGEFQNALDAIKWATDYFIKAHPEPNVLWVQVGDGESDHKCWQRPEDMRTSRPAYKIDEEHPGSEVAGETAAALAAASIVFRENNPYYSHLLLEHAQQLFEFADKFRGKYDESIEVVKEYYASTSGYKDELLWAALWLYKATHKFDYLNYALGNGESFNGTTWAIREFSWDLKFAGVQVLVAMLPRENNEEYNKILQEFHSNAEHYICAQLNRNNNNANVPRTPGGLLYIREWNALQYVTTAILLLMVYSDHLKATNQNMQCGQVLVTGDEIYAFAKMQVDYILGSNPIGMSYLVGYGSKYPQRVHHRGASIEGHDKNIRYTGCMEGYKRWFKTQDPNPNVLVGAIIGGPDKNDQFYDQRSNFVQSEACTYNTAPLVGVFAKLHVLENKNLVDNLPFLCSS
ncbi:OLC1v1008574C1 [Oldenlandia corymbosa var. corymbosa]|uniref:Endoglucanase n=1 Tax=Oldenlandia corymbosa var. corymbosa TaxID=529605 RepID=A0AAV1DMH1_OLDCO|nr:OLC1v1008574C1 [Oldenlandia corymbosa var. corymbosa]